MLYVFLVLWNFYRDGTYIHYNNWFSVGWQGGVSRMIAQVLLFKIMVAREMEVEVDM